MPPALLVLRRREGPRVRRPRVRERIVLLVHPDRHPLHAVLRNLELPVAERRLPVPTRVAEGVGGRDQRDSQVDREPRVGAVLGVAVARLPVAGENVLEFPVREGAAVGGDDRDEVVPRGVDPRVGLTPVGPDEEEQPVLVEVALVLQHQGVGLRRALQRRDVLEFRAREVVPLGLHERQEELLQRLHRHERLRLDHLPPKLDQAVLTRGALQLQPQRALQGIQPHEAVGPHAALHWEAFDRR
mmetsp:Transcript_33156/g.78545  ORF Transcript_33156/g.78545 Transcript_33156/m.78545 type:complete len:243 (-) Transcript_33156:212-940(-)